MGNVESTPSSQDPTSNITQLTTGNAYYSPSPSVPFQVPQNSFSSSINLMNTSVNNPSALNNPNSILNANPLFVLYADFSKYSSVFDITSYFKNSYDISISAEDVAILSQQLQSTGKRNVVLNIPKKAFTGNPITDDVYVTLSKSDVDEAMQIYKVCKALQDKIPREFASDIQNYAIGDQITTSHKKMHHFMDVIITTIAYYYFTSIQSLVKNKITTIIATNSNNTETTVKMQKAAMVFGSMWDTPTQAIFTSLSEFIQKFFDLSFKTRGMISDPQNIEDLKSLGNGDVYNTSAYYHLREFIIKALEKPKGNCQDILKNIKATEGPDIATYFNKLVTDIYIKTSYPLLQYQFISSMMKQYMEKGDFVNTRLALFAKVNLILYIVSVLSLVIQNFDANGAYTNVNQNELASISTLLNDIMNKLNKYIENMNKIDMTSPNANSDDEIAKIVQRLHEMSNEVKNDSKHIQYIQQNIESSRLAIRNVIYNLTIIEKKRKNKMIEFWIAFSILLLLIVSCITLLFIEKEDIVLYITGLTVFLVLLYKLVLNIISIVKKN